MQLLHCGYGPGANCIEKCQICDTFQRVLRTLAA